jgi:hypothetical protein
MMLFLGYLLISQEVEMGSFVSVVADGGGGVGGGDDGGGDHLLPP